MRIEQNQIKVALRITSPKSILSVDVEDWFHILEIPGLPGVDKWDNLPSRVESNFLKLLELFGAKGVSVTCFFLGYVARRYPHLVKQAQAAGHQIGSHGFAHKLIYHMSPDEFFNELRDSKQLLEDICGQEVIGFRAPGFSLTVQTPWFYDMLAKADFRYDSSLFPAARLHGGIMSADLRPHIVLTKHGRVVEFPITVVNLVGRRWCFFGGGYLRLFPYPIIERMARKVLAEGRPVIYYVHPRDIDPEQPRLAMNPIRRFMCYVNLSTTEGKIRRIVDAFELITFEQFIKENNLLEEKSDGQDS